MSWDARQHGFEEIRDAMIYCLTDLPEGRIRQWNDLVEETTREIARRNGAAVSPQTSAPAFHQFDVERARDAFWDLFRRGFITLGNSSGDMYPWFRLSHSGQAELREQSSFHFHDDASYLGVVGREVPDVSPEALGYLREAAATFYVDCFFASSVMLGVAAEVEFARLAEAAMRSAKYGTKFSAIARERWAGPKVAKFLSGLTAIEKDVPADLLEGLQTEFAGVQQIIRLARNDSGHAKVSSVARESAFVNLRLFVPFARHGMKLRKWLEHT